MIVWVYRSKTFRLDAFRKHNKKYKIKHEVSRVMQSFILEGSLVSRCALQTDYSQRDVFHIIFGFCWLLLTFALAELGANERCFCIYFFFDYHLTNFYFICKNKKELKCSFASFPSNDLMFQNIFAIIPGGAGIRNELLRVFVCVCLQFSFNDKNQTEIYVVCWLESS